jgi:TPR repeat protein
MKERIVEANRLFMVGDHQGAIDHLQPLLDAGDVDAQATFGTWCMLDLARFTDAEHWLRLAADSGSGLAAHNLFTLYSTGWPGRAPDRELARHYMQRAVDTGFEATVSANPLWWK